MGLPIPIQEIPSLCRGFSLNFRPRLAILSYPIPSVAPAGVSLASLPGSAHPAQKPVVQPLLRAAAGLDFVLGLGLPDQRLRLPAFDTLREKLLLPRACCEFRLRNPRRQRRGVAAGGARLLQAGQSVL